MTRMHASDPYPKLTYVQKSTAKKPKSIHDLVQARACLWRACPQCMQDDPRLRKSAEEETQQVKVDDETKRRIDELNKKYVHTSVMLLNLSHDPGHSSARRS